MLPSDLVATVSRQWPCREQQARQLAHLLCVRKIGETTHSIIIILLTDLYYISNRPPSPPLRL